MAKTCSVMYTPSLMSDTSDINFLCADNKVHVRFRDFTESEVLSGFEKKLTYLLTYLMNYSYMPTVIGQYDDNALMDNFLKTSDLTSVCTVINANTCNNIFRGLKLRKNYKKQDCKPFGEVDAACFPMKYENDVSISGSLNTFIDTFKVTLEDYLFDDSYTIVIADTKEKDSNKKFNNKAIKKKQKQSKKFKLKALW